MRRSLLIPAAVIGLAFPAGLGLAVYSASGSSLAPSDATASVPTGELARPSVPPTTTTLGGTTTGTTTEGTTTDETTTFEGTTTDETTTEDTTTVEETTTDGDSSGRGRGRGRGRSGSGSGDD
jgi:eukaryotic-like serine/threonine-protein kinase